MTVYLTHFLIEQEIYYSDRIFYSLVKAADYMKQAYSEYVGECLEEAITQEETARIQEEYDDNIQNFDIYLEDSQKNHREFCPMYYDIVVLTKIPYFGYIQEFNIV